MVQLRLQIDGLTWHWWKKDPFHDCS